MNKTTKTTKEHKIKIPKRTEEQLSEKDKNTVLKECVKNFVDSIGVDEVPTVIYYIDKGVNKEVRFMSDLRILDSVDRITFKVTEDRIFTMHSRELIYDPINKRLVGGLGDIEDHMKSNDTNEELTF